MPTRVALLEWRKQMDKIKFTFEERNEEVTFCILGHTQLEDVGYILVVDEREIDNEEPEAFILKATEADEYDVYYDIVDDEHEISSVLPALEKFLTDFEID